MGDAVHILPVGFDRDRLVGPLAKDDMPLDRVILLQGSGGDGESTNARLSARMAELIRRDLLIATPLEEHAIETRTIARVHDYAGAYKGAIELLRQELTQGASLYVNISSMPRTVSFAFATAANQLAGERPDWQSRIHIYYAAPAKYLVAEMTEVLDRQQRLLAHLLEHAQEGLGNLENEVEEALQEVTSLLRDIQEYGVTKGVKSIDGKHSIQIPIAPPGVLRDIESHILLVLASDDHVESVTKLAQEIHEQWEKGADFPSVKSKVTYNVQVLASKGLVGLDERGRRRIPRLTDAGRLFASTFSAA